MSSGRHPAATVSADESAQIVPVSAAVAGPDETSAQEVAAPLKSSEVVTGDTTAEPTAIGDRAIASMASVLALARETPPETPADVLLDGSVIDVDEAEAGVPSKTVVHRTMSSIAPKIKECHRASSGQVVLKLAVAGNTGRVIYAIPVEKTDIGISEALCAARLVKLVKFPKFDSARFTMTYTFEI